MARSVLIVEPDPDLRQAVSMVLTRAGFSVAAVDNTGEGLARLRAGGPLPDVVFLAMAFAPGHDDTANFLAEKQKDASISGIPVVAASASLQMPPKVDGVVAVLRKPFDPELLVRTLELL